MKIGCIIISALVLLSMTGCQTLSKLNDTSSKSSGDFGLTLNTDKESYKTSEEIKLWGTFEYKGKQNSVTIWHDNPLINFYIESKSDSFKWEPLNDLVSINTTINKKDKYVTYFQKPNISQKDIESIEDEKMKKFMQDPKLHLPKGIYEVKALMKFSTSKDFKSDITLITSFCIKVED